MGERRQSKKCLLTSAFCARLNKIVTKEKWSHQQIAGWSNTDRTTVAKVLKNSPFMVFSRESLKKIEFLVANQQLIQIICDNLSHHYNYQRSEERIDRHSLP
jgi:hypothetical protein